MHSSAPAGGPAPESQSDFEGAGAPGGGRSGQALGWGRSLRLPLLLSPFSCFAFFLPPFSFALRASAAFLARAASASALTLTLAAASASALAWISSAVGGGGVSADSGRQTVRLATPLPRTRICRFVRGSVSGLISSMPSGRVTGVVEQLSSAFAVRTASRRTFSAWMRALLRS